MEKQFKYFTIRNDEAELIVALINSLEKVGLLAPEFLTEKELKNRARILSIRNYYKHLLA